MTDPATIPATTKWTRVRALARVGRDLANRMSRAHVIFGLVAAATMAVSFASAPGPVGALGAGLALVMLTIAVVDWRRFIIPDGLNLVAAALGIMHAAALMSEAIPWAAAMSIARGVTLALMFLALRLGYARIRGRQGLGLGDVKLAFVAGAWLDWLIMPIAIELAAVAALAVYLWRQRVLGHALTRTSRMPFGVFMAPAIWLGWLLQTRWLVF
jgi:leader peptidase (prepilin peptidase) / N-methyltransferase